MLVSDTYEWNPTSKIREQKLFCLDFWSRISLPQTLWTHQQCAGMTILICTYQLQEYAKNQVWIGRFWNFPHFQVMLMSWFNSFSLSTRAHSKPRCPILSLAFPTQFCLLPWLCDCQQILQVFNSCFLLCWAALEGGRCFLALW